MRRRASGILLHLSSLPGRHGIGDLGPDAFAWVDFLAEAKQQYWQMLPLNPTTQRGNNSPYEALSAFAGNPLFISPAVLLDDGWLTPGDLDGLPALPEDRVDYDAVAAVRRPLLDRAYERFAASTPPETFVAFCDRHAHWLDDYAMFVGIRERRKEEMWSQWPASLRDRLGLSDVGEDVRRTAQREKFLQYLFFKQWFALKRYANACGVHLVGDLPFYVGYDSADVWSHPHLFKLDNVRKPRFIAGVPPDLFSDTGQLWTNPVYDWAEQAKDGYAWWIERLSENLQQFDLLRVDHFRGFAAHWEVPGDQDTAVAGEWVEGPGRDFFDTLFRRQPNPALIAEDLGHITADVSELIRAYGFPTMKVLLFGFDNDSGCNPYDPHNHVANAVVYTGTHDNNTVRGWFRTEASDADKMRLGEYLGHTPTERQVHWDIIRLAMMSVGRLAIIPMQDVLGLDENARMNRPAIEKGNWVWRMRPGEASAEVAERLARLTELCGRA